MPSTLRSPNNSAQANSISRALMALADRCRNGAAHIGIYGLGYVGLPLALRFAEVGIRVTGFDIDPNKIELLNNGKSYIERITPAKIQKAQQAGFTATTDFALTSELDAQIICSSMASTLGLGKVYLTPLFPFIIAAYYSYFRKQKPRRAGVLV